MQFDAEITRAFDAWFKLQRDRWFRLFQSESFSEAMQAGPVGTVEADGHVVTERDRSATHRALTIGDAEQMMGLLEDAAQNQSTGAGRAGAHLILSSKGLEPDALGAHALDILQQRVTDAEWALHDARKRWAEGDAGFVPCFELNGEPALASAALTPPLAAPVSSGELILGKLIETYVHHQTHARKLNGKEVNQLRAHCELLMTQFGSEFAVSALTPRMAGEFFGAMRLLPKGFGGLPELRGLSVIEAGKRALALGLAPMNPKTVNNKMTALRGLMESAVMQRVTSANPFTGMFLRERDAGENEKPFLAGEIEEIFASPVFLGCKHRQHPFQPGAYLLNDWRFWLPVVAAVSGARIGELCQLSRKDVCHSDGVLVLSVNTENAKRAKTPASKRIIPVHPELLRLGFEAYVASRPDTDTPGSLFGITKPRNGVWSGASGNWFRDKFLPNVLGGRKRAGTGFHSFRHNMKTALRGVGSDELTDKLLGHTAANRVAAAYGRYGAEKLLTHLKLAPVPLVITRIPPRTT